MHFLLFICIIVFTIRVFFQVKTFNVIMFFFRSNANTAGSSSANRVIGFRTLRSPVRIHKTSAKTWTVIWCPSNLAMNTILSSTNVFFQIKIHGLDYIETPQTPLYGNGPVARSFSFPTGLTGNLILWAKSVPPFTAVIIMYLNIEIFGMTLCVIENSFSFVKSHFEYW